MTLSNRAWRPLRRHRLDNSGRADRLLPEIPRRQPDYYPPNVSGIRIGGQHLLAVADGVLAAETQVPVIGDALSGAPQCRGT